MGLKCRRPLDMGNLKQKMPEVIRVVIFLNDPNQKRPKMIPVPFQIDDPNRQGPALLKVPSLQCRRSGFGEGPS